MKEKGTKLSTCRHRLRGPLLTKAMVLFACFTYFRRRAKVRGIEDEIAKERLESWISCSGHSPSTHDSVHDDQGLMEPRKLAIEHQLWEVSCKETEQDSSAAAWKYVAQLKIPTW